MVYYHWLKSVARDAARGALLTAAWKVQRLKQWSPVTRAPGCRQDQHSGTSGCQPSNSPGSDWWNG